MKRSWAHLWRSYGALMAKLWRHKLNLLTSHNFVVCIFRRPVTSHNFVGCIFFAKETCIFYIFSLSFALKKCTFLYMFFCTCFQNFHLFDNFRLASTIENCNLLYILCCSCMKKLQMFYPAADADSATFICSFVCSCIKKLQRFIYFRLLLHSKTATFYIFIASRISPGLVHSGGVGSCGCE